MLEIIIVLALILIIGLVSYPSLFSMIEHMNKTTTEEKIVEYIRKAQSYRMGGWLNTGWGICLYDTNYIALYRFTCTETNIKEKYEIPATVTVTGLSNTQFINPRGEPNNPQTININLKDQSSTIILNQVGGIEFY